MRSLIRERLRNCSTNIVHQVYRQIFSLFVTWILFLTPYQIQVYVIWALRVGLNFFFFFFYNCYMYTYHLFKGEQPHSPLLFFFECPQALYEMELSATKWNRTLLLKEKKRHLNQDFTWFHITVYDTNSYIKKIDNNLKFFHNIVLKV